MKRIDHPLARRALVPVEGATGYRGGLPGVSAGGFNGLQNLW